MKTTKTVSIHSKQSKAKRKIQGRVCVMLLILAVSVIGAFQLLKTPATANAATAKQLKVGDFSNAPTLKLNKKYLMTGLASGKRAGYVRLDIKKATKVSFQVSDVKSGMIHLQIYRVKNHYTSKLIHDMQVFAPSDENEIEKNTKKYTWDQQSADSMYLTLKPGVYCLRFESGDDVYSGTTAGKKCGFKVQKV